MSEKLPATCESDKEYPTHVDRNLLAARRLGALPELENPVPALPPWHFNLLFAARQRSMGEMSIVYGAPLKGARHSSPVERPGIEN